MPEIPIKSDRAARDSKNYPTFHATDLEDGTPMQHLPTATSVNDIPYWDGEKYVAGQVGGPIGIPVVPSRYVHEQSVASAEWVINHNLNTYPVVVIVDSAGTVVIGDVDYDDANTCTITFSSAFGGKAYLT